MKSVFLGIKDYTKDSFHDWFCRFVHAMLENCIRAMKRKDMQ